MIFSQMGKEKRIKAAVKNNLVINERGLWKLEHVITENK